MKTIGFSKELRMMPPLYMSSPVFPINVEPLMNQMNYRLDTLKSNMVNSKL